MSEKKVSLPIYRNPKESLVSKLIQRPTFEKEDLNSTIQNVFDKVKSEGDKALFEWTREFDQVKLNSILLTPQEADQSLKSLDEELKVAIDQAYGAIKTFHLSQQEVTCRVTTSPGVECWRESRPISKVGLYIPGGSAPLFSTVLMLGVPAQIAGCQEVMLCTPPNKIGDIHPAIVYAASLCGIRNIARIGGAQAIAAMTLGTDTIFSVHKIFGPGNQYVTAAKMLAQSYGVGIDLPAGPSEVLVYADPSADPSFVAADLLAQAEHGPDSQVVLVTTDESIITFVNEELNRQLSYLKRSEIAILALNHAFAAVFENTEDAFNFINAYAPEHLVLLSDQAGKFRQLIQNAGSVFVGHFTPESAGDYASGTNHTLPTAGYAKSYSGVSLDSFVKKITFQQITRDGLKKLGPTVVTMANHELLSAHANAVEIRLKEI